MAVFEDVAEREKGSGGIGVLLDTSDTSNRLLGIELVAIGERSTATIFGLPRVGKYVDGSLCRFEASKSRRGV